MRWYYPITGKQTAQTTFQVFNIGFKAVNLVIVNDSGTDDIEFSWDGATTHGHIIPGEPLNLGDLDFSEIWIKKSAGAATFRIWAYAR